MTTSEGVVASAEPSPVRLEPAKNTHLPGKTSPCPSPGKRAVYGDGDSKVTSNGIHDIEDRILRITGYYGYNPGYSSHRNYNNWVCYHSSFIRLLCDAFPTNA
uniref:Uncharacterized protein n=1 Tax=Knipowitschia caucasica TaxID=637954 RepID=A0AAV2JGJ1_KNICA